MAACVETMMCVGRPAWHGLGKQLEFECDSETAIKAAGLDWEVEVAPIITNDQKMTAVDAYRVTRRVTDDAVLGIVKKGWKPIQNRDAFKFFDSVVGDKAAVYHTAGSLQGGSRVWILAKLPEVLEIGKGVGSVDPVERYLLLSNFHCGNSPLQMLFTPVRVVCQNTLSMALHRQDEEGEWCKLAPRIKVRHSSGAAAMLSEAGRTMKAALNYYERFGDFANYLYKSQLNGQQVKSIVAEIFPLNKKKEITTTIAYNRAEVERLFVEGKGHEAIAGSAWALLQAVSEFADHDFSHKKGGTIEKHSFSVLYGGAKGLKQRAERVITTALAA